MSSVQSPSTTPAPPQPQQQQQFDAAFLHHHQQDSPKIVSHDAVSPPLSRRSTRSSLSKASTVSLNGSHARKNSTLVHQQHMEMIEKFGRTASPTKSIPANKSIKMDAPKSSLLVAQGVNATTSQQAFQVLQQVKKQQQPPPPPSPLPVQQTNTNMPDNLHDYKKKVEVLERQLNEEKEGRLSMQKELDTIKKYIHEKK